MIQDRFGFFSLIRHLSINSRQDLLQSLEQKDVFIFFAGDFLMFANFDNPTATLSMVTKKDEKFLPGFNSKYVTLFFPHLEGLLLVCFNY